MSETLLQPQLNIYDQLTGQPRRDFYDMQHFPVARDETLVKQVMLNQDWDRALEENGTPEDTPATEHLEDLEDDPELFSRLWTGDVSAIPVMYEKYSKKAEKIARKYISFVSEYHVDDDLLQAAQLGLGEAAKTIIEHRTKMDDIGVIVYYRVLGQVYAELTRNNHFGSEWFGRKQHKLFTTEELLIAKLGRHPSLREVAVEMDCSKEEVLLLRLTQRAFPIEETPNILDMPSTEESVHTVRAVDEPLTERSLLVESTEDLVLNSINEELRREAERKVAQQALKSLTALDRDIFERAYGLNGYRESQDSKEIATEIGETRENVRQILSRRRKNLQKQLVSPYDPSESEAITDGRFIQSVRKIPENQA